MLDVAKMAILTNCKKSGREKIKVKMFRGDEKGCF